MLTPDSAMEPASAADGRDVQPVDADRLFERLVALMGAMSASLENQGRSLTRIADQVADMGGRLDGLDARLDGLDGRLDRLEAQVAEVGERGAQTYHLLLERSSVAYRRLRIRPAGDRPE